MTLDRKAVIARSGLLNFLAISILLVGLVGCGKKLVSVGGVVTVDDQPVSGVNLRFFPQGESADGMPSAAKSGEGGRFTVSTNAEPGMYRGKYLVNADYPDPEYQPKKEPGLNFGEPEPPPDKLKGRYTNNADIFVEITGSTSDLKIELKSQ